MSHFSFNTKVHSALVCHRRGIFLLRCSLIWRLWFQCRVLWSLSSRIIRYVAWIIGTKPPGSREVHIELLLDVKAHYKRGEGRKYGKCTLTNK